MRNIKILGLLAIGVTFLTTSCKKTEIITNTVHDSVRICDVDTIMKMNTRSWNAFSYKTLALLDSGVTTYFTTAEGIKIIGQDYRLGTRVQTKSEFAFHNKVIYFKWKGSGGGQFASYVPQIKYDILSNDGLPTIQGVDLGLFANQTLQGYVLVQDNTWYYTRVSPVTGTDNFQVTTSTGNYSNMGGSVISTKTLPIYTKSGYLALRLGDPYGGTSASAVLSECKIASN